MLGSVITLLELETNGDYLATRRISAWDTGSCIRALQLVADAAEILSDTDNEMGYDKVIRMIRTIIDCLSGNVE